MSLLILLLAAGGHVAMVRWALDVVYRVKMPPRVWAAVVVADIAVGVAVLLMMLDKIGLSGQWGQVGTGWMAYLCLCLLALATAIVRSIASVMRQAPAALVSRVTKSVNMPRGICLGPTDSLVSMLAHLPGNQIVDLQINEDHLRVARVPQDWDGLSIVHLSDLHMNGIPTIGYYERVCEAVNGLKPDIVAVTGDLVDHPAMIKWLPWTLGKIKAPLGNYFVLGNQDAYAAPAHIRQTMTDLGWIDVGGQVVQGKIRGHDLLVAGTEVPWLGRHPAVRYGQGPAFALLLSHAPHHLPWAAEHGFDLMLAGHLHGGQVRLPLLGSIGGGRMASGIFERPPTVMHVSPGIGVNFHFRWGCPPQLSKLTLHGDLGSARKKDHADLTPSPDPGGDSAADKLEVRNQG